MIFADLKTNLRYQDNLTNTLNIVNIKTFVMFTITKYINVHIKTSLCTSSHEIISNYVMLCN